MTYQRTGNLQSAVQQLLGGGFNPARGVIASGTSTAAPYTVHNTTSYYQIAYFYGVAVSFNVNAFTSPDNITNTLVGTVAGVAGGNPFNFCVIIAPGEYGGANAFGQTINYVVKPF